jgi:hypothetical protein
VVRARRRIAMKCGDEIKSLRCTGRAHAPVWYRRQSGVTPLSVSMLNADFPGGVGASGRVARTRPRPFGRGRQRACGRYNSALALYFLRVRARHRASHGHAPLPRFAGLFARAPAPVFPSNRQ